MKDEIQFSYGKCAENISNIEKKIATITELSSPNHYEFHKTSTMISFLNNYNELILYKIWAIVYL